MELVKVRNITTISTIGTVGTIFDGQHSSDGKSSITIYGDFIAERVGQQG